MVSLNNIINVNNKKKDIYFNIIMFMYKLLTNIHLYDDLILI